MKRTSLSARLMALALSGVAVTALVAFFATKLQWAPVFVLTVSLVVGGAFTAIALGQATASARHALLALTDGVRGFQASDYSLRLFANRNDEIGELLELYNKLADVMREERRDVFQRELLLDTLLQGAPVATVLATGNGRVVFSNRTAREFLGAGKRLEGQRWDDILRACPPAMRDGLAVDDDVLFKSPDENGDETFRSTRRTFQINAQMHTLYTVERLTPELRRREVEVWKNAIRIVNHELNNSLAPIQSLVHSARLVLGRPEHLGKLDEIFEAVEERVKHLAVFLDGYAKIAKVPRPKRQEVPWEPFLAEVQRLGAFRVEGPLPRVAGFFDPMLVQQVLINLLKNARESGSSPDDIAVNVDTAPDEGAVVRVFDRGRGMDTAALAQAHLPFYTSKPTGTGVGLALSNEIIEAHGGRLRLENRPGGGLTATFRLPGRGSVEPISRRKEPSSSRDP
ncbi:sensor histidine kinase [Pendulispora albinea]|uniref:histidine kinase n=1 Tax=Pendulispora albinea TaxID=2741071 RepID=A0ABZ2LSI8_9BACT